MVEWLQQENIDREMAAASDGAKGLKDAGKVSKKKTFCSLISAAAAEKRKLEENEGKEEGGEASCFPNSSLNSPSCLSAASNVPRLHSSTSSCYSHFSPGGNFVSRAAVAMCDEEDTKANKRLGRRKSQLKCQRSSNIYTRTSKNMNSCLSFCVADIQYKSIHPKEKGKTKKLFELYMYVVRSCSSSSNTNIHEDSPQY